MKRTPKTIARNRKLARDGSRLLAELIGEYPKIEREKAAPSQEDVLRDLAEIAAANASSQLSASYTGRALEQQRRMMARYGSQQGRGITGNEGFLGILPY